MPQRPTDRLDPQALLQPGGARAAHSATHLSVEVTAGPDQGKSARLEGSATVGTHPEAAFTLSDSSVSRYHVELLLHPFGVRVRDLGSTNGTFLNDARVHDIVVPDATLRLGRTLLKVVPSTALSEEALRPPARFGEAIARSERMRALFDTLARVAATDAYVLLGGETGSGKGALARALHDVSDRSAGPFRVLDCAAVAPSLVESELFGHAKGAFTGAHQASPGAFVSAHGGTLFLDEVAELPLEVQPKLLRALETGVVHPLGDSREREVDVRIIAATHRDLPAAVASGAFRKDLYYRLAVLVADVPPLRERLEDLPLLAHHFVTLAGRPDFHLSSALLERLAAHPWPGNVRELRNVIERSICGLDALPPEVSPPEAAAVVPFKQAKAQLVDDFTREYFAALLERCQGNLTEVASLAGIARTHLYDVLSRHGLRADEPGTPP